MSLRRRMMMGQGGHADYSKQYLTFTAVGGQSNFYFSEDYLISGTTEKFYSLDGGTTWTALAANTNTPYIQDGESILWKANGISIGRYQGITFHEANTYGWIASGNIMSLLHGDDFVGQTTLTKNTQFRALFEDCVSLRDASNLILPATTLTLNCYYEMFYGCTSLVNAPVLPAPTLVSSCYYHMFYGCSSLNYIRALRRIIAQRHQLRIGCMA